MTAADRAPNLDLAYLAYLALAPYRQVDDALREARAALEIHFWPALHRLLRTGPTAGAPPIPSFAIRLSLCSRRGALWLHPIDYFPETSLDTRVSTDTEVPMKSALIFVAVLLCAPAYAASPSSIRDYAEVVSAEPMYRTTRVRVPVEDCYDTTERSSPSYAMTNGVAGAVVGAIAGGVAGHQFGKGRGKDAATIGGAIIGAGVGQRVAHQNFPDGEERVVTRCAQHAEYESRQSVSGYRVQYRYMGRLHETTTREHPGSSLPVSVRVTPDLR